MFRGCPVMFRGGPTMFQGGPVMYRGGPAMFGGGPALFRGGPAMFRDGPAMFRDGPAMFFLSLTTWDTDTQEYLSFNLNNVHQSQSLRVIEFAHHNVLLEYGELPCVLPYTVHLDLGYCPDTQGYLGLLSGPYTPSHTL